MNTEQWATASEAMGNYEVSSHGRVRRIETGRVLTEKIGRFGYLRVHLRSIDSKNGVNPLVHRLVAKAFIPNPDNLPQVNHKDGNKRNNAVGNLEWVTAKGNFEHALSAGLRKSSVGSTNYNAKLDDATVREVVRLYREGMGHTQIARILGNVKPPAIYKITTGRHWAHLGLITPWKLTFSEIPLPLKAPPRPFPCPVAQNDQL